MRVVAGAARGIRLKAPRGHHVRPTSDRVKEALFASLGTVRDQLVIDLFAGSGALGIEAWSRGAARVVFVERDPKALRSIRENLGQVRRALGDAARGEPVVAKLDVAQVPGRMPELSGRVDLILADPPYHPGRGGYGAAEMLCDAAFAEWAGDALLVLEHAVEPALPWGPRGCWTLLHEKHFGRTALAFARVSGRG